nr:MAG TPA: hypothetical protein [Caudoviricetes sp.]
MNILPTTSLIIIHVLPILSNFSLKFYYNCNVFTVHIIAISI